MFVSLGVNMQGEQFVGKRKELGVVALQEAGDTIGKVSTKAIITISLG